MSIDRRTFTFASLTLLAQGVPVFASSAGHALELSSQWSARLDGDLLYLTLIVRNLTTEELTLLSHKGLRPAPELVASYTRGEEERSIRFAPLSDEEDRERRSRGMPRRKWITLKPKTEMKLCSFRMTKPTALSLNDRLRANVTIKLHGNREVKLSSAPFSVHKPSAWS